MNLQLPSLKYQSEFLHFLKSAQKEGYWTQEEPSVSNFDSILSSKLLRLFASSSGNEEPAVVYWVIGKNQEFLGTIKILLREPKDAFSNQIDIFVAKEHRQQGYGSEFLKLALEKCKNLNFKTVTVVCQRSNDAANRVIMANLGKLVHVTEDDNVVYEIETR